MSPRDTGAARLLARAETVRQSATPRSAREARLASRPERSWFRYSWPISLVGFVGLWWVVVLLARLPRFVLPSPADVALRLWDYLPQGQLALHFETTIVEVLLGGAAGVLFGLLSGYALARSAVAEKLASPYLVASQSVPVIAFTPMLILWFGTGLLSKVIVCAIITFFPMTIAAVTGLRSVDPGLVEVMQTFGASRRQILRWIELPAALPNIFGGLKVAGTLAMVGAIVAEFVGAKSGLGYLVNYSAFQLDTPLMFVGLLCLVALGLAIYSLISLVERRALRWRQRGHSG